MSLSVSPAFTNFLTPLNYLFTTFVWLWLPQYEGKLGLDLLLFRLSHTQVWTLQGHHTFLCWEHQRNRETPPTSAAHQYLLIQKSTLWERTPGSCSSSGWLLIEWRMFWWIHFVLPPCFSQCQLQWVMVMTGVISQKCGYLNLKIDLLSLSLKKNIPC